MSTTLALLASTGVFCWGVWDWFHSDRPSPGAFVKAVVGLGAIALLVVRAVV